MSNSVEESKASRDDDERNECDDDCQFIFPQRLMSILSDERNTDAICWLPHGRAFIIRNRKLFGEMVMPKFFPRKSKYSSFTRKLNRWNFVRVSSGPELGAYYHEFFLRDKPQLAAQMFCKNARTKIAMATPSASSQPSETAPAQSNYEAHVLQQKLMGGVDAAQMFLTGQGLDPQTQQLLQQELQHMNMQPQNNMLQNNLMGVRDSGLSSNMNLLQGANANALVQQIQAQKQQQARMLQLQQLMALNLQRQQKRRPTSNNFRASAA
jgi:hypothetical protein